MGSEEEGADAVTEESAAGGDQTKSASPESEGEAAADYLEGLLDIIDAAGLYRSTPEEPRNDPRDDDPESMNPETPAIP